MPSLLILLPFIVLIVLNLPSRNITIKAGFWFVLLLSVIQIALVIGHPVLFWSTAADPLGPFFAFKFSVDNLTLILLLSIGIVLFASVFTGWHTFDDEKHGYDFTNLLLIALIGMNAIAMLTDIFSLYVFIEITAVASFILIACRRDKLAVEGAFKYIIITVIATIMMLIAIALLMFISGGTSFSAIRTAIKVYPESIYIKFAVGLFLCGILIKSGAVPFHGWVPDAYSASPSPVSVLLAGIITKASGVYVLMRFLISIAGFSSYIQDVLMFVGIISIVVGAFASLGQTDFKRMLAYSSISQVGYIILGLGCGTPLAVAGSIFHFFNHAVFKSLLFVNAAAVEKQLGTTDMDKMGGLAERMPVTGVTSIIGFLSTAGIPPLSGFWSKLIIILALWKAGDNVYAVLALLASVVTLAYLLSMQSRVFFGKIKEGLENVTEVSFGLIVPEIALASVAVGVGIFFPFMFDKFIILMQSISW